MNTEGDAVGDRVGRNHPNGSATLLANFRIRSAAMRGLLLSLSLCGVVLAAGCGSSGGDPDTDPAALAPARAPIYAEVSLESDDDFKSVASKLSGKPDASAEITKLLEQSINEDGANVDFEKDLKPWIGDRIGIYFTDLSDDDSQGAFLAPTKDADKAEKSLAKLLKETDEDDKKPQISGKKYKDVEYQVDSANDSAYAVIDGTAVFGTEQGVKGSIDAQDGESLAETDGLKTARDQVEDDGLVFAYASLRQLASAFGSGAEAAQFQQLLGQSGDRIAMSGDVEDDAIQFEVAQLGIKDGINAEPGSLLAEMPADAWLAGGLADFGKTIEQQLKTIEGTPEGKELTSALSQVQSATGIDVRSDVLSWIGDIGIFVRGSSINDIGGALVIAASDPEKPKKLLAQLQQLAKSAGDASLKPLDRDGVEGVTITTDEIPMPIHVGVGDSKLIVAVGDDALKEAVSPSSKLTDSQEFKDATAQLEDVKPSFFVNLEPVRSLLEASGALDQAGANAEDVKRVLDHLTTIAGGSATKGDVQTTKFSVRVK
jgi:hypothetical protein